MEARFASREAKSFVNLFRKILLLQQMFPRLRAEENFGKQCFRTQRFLGFREPLDDFSESNRSHLLTESTQEQSI